MDEQFFVIKISFKIDSNLSYEIFILLLHKAK